MKRSRSKKNVSSDLFFSFLLLILIIGFILSFQRVNSLKKAEGWVKHSYQVELKLNQFLVSVINAESSQRGYLLTKDSSFLRLYGGIEKNSVDILKDIQKLTSDNPNQQQAIAHLSLFVNRRFEYLDSNIILYNHFNSQTNLFSGRFIQGRIIMDSIKAGIASMITAERDLLNQRIVTSNQWAYETPLYFTLFSLLAVLILISIFFGLRHEKKLRLNAQRNEFEIKRLQEETKESEMRFRTIADTVPVMIWLSGVDQLRFYFNRSWLAFCGRSLGEEKGYGWLEGVLPEDREKYLDVYASAVDKKVEFYAEYRLKRSDGAYRWISDKGVPRFSPDGTFLGYSGACTDIHEQVNFSQELERQVAERTTRLKLLNEQLSVQNNIFSHAEEVAKIGSFSWNLQSMELKYSDQLFRLLGCEPQSFTPSFEMFLSFIHPDDLEQVISDGQKTLETRTLSEHVYRIISKDSQLKYFRSSGTFTGPHESQYLLGTVQDISRDVSMNESLRLKNMELERSNAELASFSYIASHDLKEPLRKIQIFSSLILSEETSISERGKNYFNRIMASVSRMQLLIRDLLEYSISTTIDIHLQETDLNRVLQEVVTQFKELIEEKKAVIKAGELPVIQAIPQQFYQLFSNLLSNSLKYSKNGDHPIIEIHCSVVTAESTVGQNSLQPGKYWQISISDNGIGFDQEKADKIFEVFQRLHARTEYDGTGIGLAICKKIVQNHKGIITAEGAPGRGAKFKIWLPHKE